MVALSCVIAAAEGTPDACHATPEGMRQIVIEEGWGRALVACEPADPNRVLGMILYYPAYSSFAGERGYFIENIAVSEDAQGRGVATALFDAMIEAGRAEGVAKVEWACDRANPARRFYEHRLKAQPLEKYMLYAYPIPD